MPLPLLLIAAAAAAHQPSSRPAPSFSSNHGAGRAFMSPMGEPFFANASGADGLATWFSQADLNHDGSITADEMSADAQRFFQVLDSNKDGEIDPDEITHYEETIEAKGFRYSLLNIPEPVISADADFNRGVSTSEFRNAASKRFQLLDVNHTGRLTLSGLQVVREAAASQAKHPLGEKSEDVPLDPKGDTESVVPQ
jgi:Ca2+-binding EF-hand superfamily protein